MKTQHTPGPWNLFANGHCVQGSDRAGVAMCSMAKRSEAENFANARLIAKAPELLTACMRNLLVFYRIGKRPTEKALDAVQDVSEVQAFARDAIEGARIQ